MVHNTVIIRTWSEITSQIIHRKQSWKTETLGPQSCMSPEVTLNPGSIPLRHRTAFPAPAVVIPGNAWKLTTKAPWSKGGDSPPCVVMKFPSPSSGNHLDVVSPCYIQQQSCCRLCRAARASPSSTTRYTITRCSGTVCWGSHSGTVCWNIHPGTMYWGVSPDIIICGWLGLKAPTNYWGVCWDFPSETVCWDHSLWVNLLRHSL